MKKFYFLTLALICAFVANAANIPAGTKLYLTPNSNWKAENARFAAYFYGNGDAWVSMTKVAGETDLYEVTSPSKSYTNVIFCRMKPSDSANNWDNRWNQTSDLTYDGTNNHYTVKAGTWNQGGGTWSYYGVTEELLLGISWSPEKTIYPGDEVTINASVVGQPEGSSIQITIDGKTTTGTTATWTAGEAGNYTVKVACVGSDSKEIGSKEDIIKVTAVTSSFNVYLLKSSVSWTNVHIYAWNDGGDIVTDAWPGTAMNTTTVETIFNGDVEYYYFTIKNQSTVNVVFNNGSDLEKTVDLTGVTKDTYFELGGMDNGKYTATSSGVPTAIEEVGVDAGEAVYYNLQGVKVANPENGIFIKKQGGRTSKVVL